MPSPTYPEAADLVAFLGTGGLDLDPAQVGVAVLAGIEAFEREAGRHMLAGLTIENEIVAPYARTYPPPDSRNGYLDFDADLAMMESVVFQPTGSNPGTWVEGVEYRLNPQNAPFDRRPYEGMHLLGRWWHPRSFDYGAAVSVTGAWGYGLLLPDDAWMAMLMAGTVSLIDMHVISTTNLSLSWKEADVSEDYGVEPAKQRIDSLRAIIDGTVARYHKPSL